MNTKLHAITDANGRPLSFFMTAGQISDYTGAAAIATIMLAISFAMFLAINVIQAWARRRFGDV